MAEELQQQADPAWLWKNRHAKLVDGFTFTMPDTPKNAAEFPHPRTQKKGVGLPIARAVAILSLATACVMDAAIGPYKGKETGETALLRSMSSSLHAGDIAVFDRHYCSFMMIALLLLQGTDVCARLHQMRKSDFRRGNAAATAIRSCRNPDTSSAKNCTNIAPKTGYNGDSAIRARNRFQKDETTMTREPAVSASSRVPDLSNPRPSIR